MARYYPKAARRVQGFSWGAPPLMNTSVACLVGFQSAGLWFGTATVTGFTNWSLFWGDLYVAMAAVLSGFLAACHGRGAGLTRVRPNEPTAGQGSEAASAFKTPQAR